MNRKIEFEANRLLDLTCCTDLPIDVHKIARHCGYNVRNYSACKALIKRLSLDELVTKYRSVSFMYDNAYYILLSDSLTKDEERKLIAHEIGHIKLHSLNRCGVVGHGDGVCDTVARENEADTFALHLLAPLPLLCEQKIKDPSCIKDLTGLSLVDCRTVFESLREYRYECCVINGRNRLLERSKRTIKQSVFTLRSVSLLLCTVVLLCFLSFVNATAISHNASQELNSVAPVAAVNTSPENAPASSVTLDTRERVADGVTSATSAVSSSLDTTETYYWTDSGTVYHSFRSCQSLKNSTEIRSGTLSQAQTENPRLCKFCVDRSN